MLISRILPYASSHYITATTSLLLHRYKMANEISKKPVCCSANMTKYEPVTHVIFDMDGLLLDTVRLYGVLRQKILGEFGIEYNLQLNISSQGLLGREVAENIVKQFNLPISVDEYLKRSAKLAPEIFANSKLLPDTEVIYEKIISQIAESYGKKYTKEVRLRVLGTTEQMTANLVVKLCGLPVSDEEFLIKFREIQKTMLGESKLMAGAEKLIRHLHAKKVPIAVATSSANESVEVKTKNYKELFSLFHHIVKGSSDPEVKNGKPAPDIFIVCASRFPDKPACKKCLVFEDAPNGVIGAKAAGMQTVMVPDPELPKDRTTDATLVIDSLLNFKPELFGLPPY